MHIVITGGTGLIGRALIEKLSSHQITVLTRNRYLARSLFSSDIYLCTQLDALPDFNEVDAVINLAGEPIVGKRWNLKQKEKICASRWNITEKLVEKINQVDNPPHTFISSSAVGIYGNQGSHILDETSYIQASDFAHMVCDNWEKIALKASKSSRVCLLRTGVVLSPNGGALQKMLLPYQLGLGGPIGSGLQYMSWIHITDTINAILHLLLNSNAKGAFNLTAPHPVTNREFSQTLAHTLHRPHLLFTPEFAIKLLLGQASQLLLDSQRALPKALQKTGFEFSYPQLSNALEDLLL